MFEDAEVIFRYTRAQAIEDGVLIDVSGTAREAGLRYPTAVTAGVWAECVAVPEGVVGQDEPGRLWDVLWMLRCAIAGAIPSRRPRPDPTFYKLHVRNDNRDRTPPLVELKALCHPGDDPEPVITVMLPHED